MSLIYTHSEIGPRNENQDFVGYKFMNNLIIGCIADGVGGNKNGKFISKFVVEKLLNDENLNELSKFEDKIYSINNEVLELQNDIDYSDMATTLTFFVINGKKLYGFHIGDSRLCILRRNGIKQLTRPHTSAYRALKAGVIGVDQYKDINFKNILENAIGIKDLKIDVFSFDLENDDRIIISTDGFHDVMSKREIVDISIKNKNSLEKCFENLVWELNKKTLTDNSSFLIYQYN
jgi:serine/threonine protein phosphatase PrpC